MLFSVGGGCCCSLTARPPLVLKKQSSGTHWPDALVLLPGVLVFFYFCSLLLTALELLRESLNPCQYDPEVSIYPSHLAQLWAPPLFFSTAGPEAGHSPRSRSKVMLERQICKLLVMKA